MNQRSNECTWGAFMGGGLVPGAAGLPLEVNKFLY